MSVHENYFSQGAVIVSTPQDLALLDARRGVEMFKAVNVPVLGLVENMSVFECPKCGEQSYIFGHEAIRKVCREMNLDILCNYLLHYFMYFFLVHYWSLYGVEFCRLSSIRHENTGNERRRKTNRCLSARKQPGIYSFFYIRAEKKAVTVYCFSAGQSIFEVGGRSIAKTRRENNGCIAFTNAAKDTMTKNKK